MKKFSLDFILFATMTYLMCYRFVPRLPHEVLGTALIFAMALHLYWNRKTFKFSAINSILIATFAISIISGIILSHELFRDFIDPALRKNFIVHRLHAAIPYYAMIFSGIHLGLKLNWKIHPAICGLICIAGIWGAVQASLPMHLIFERVRFASRNPDFSLELFLPIITMYLMFVAIGYLWRRRKKFFRRESK